MPALIVKEGPSAGHRVEVTGETVLGRAESELLQHDTEVSGRHAVVGPGPGGLEVEDLGSSNGTFVNEHRIEDTTSLNAGDVLRLGQTSFDVEVEAAQQRTVIREPYTSPAEPPPPSEVTAPVEPAAPAEPPPAARSEPPPAEPPAYAPPPTPTPAPTYAPPPAAPAYPSPPGVAATGARAGAITAAAILLILIGLASLAYNGYDVVLLFGDLEFFQSVGFGGLAITAIVIDIALIISALLQLTGGIRLLGLSRAGRALSLIGCAGVVAGWVAFLVLVTVEGLSVTTLAWAALVISVVGSVVAGVLLLSSSRAFPSPY